MPTGNFGHNHRLSALFLAGSEDGGNFHEKLGKSTLKFVARNFAFNSHRCCPLAHRRDLAWHPSFNDPLNCWGNHRFSLSSWRLGENPLGQYRRQSFSAAAVQPSHCSGAFVALYRAFVTLDRVNPCLCIGETADQLNPEAQGEVIALVPARRLPLVLSSAQACRQFLRHQVGITADHLHLFSAFLISVARALNDAPKIAAIGLLAQSPLSQPVIFAAVALAMGIGSLIGGRRVTKTLAEKITPIDNRTGLSANLTISLLVSGCANLGLPVSTTHVTGGAIVGIGIAKGTKSVYWKVVRDIVMAWCVTMPVCGLLSAVIAFVALRL